MTEKLILGDLSAGKFENIDRFILVQYLQNLEHFIKATLKYDGV